MNIWVNIYIYYWISVDGESRVGWMEEGERDGIVGAWYMEGEEKRQKTSISL